MSITIGLTQFKRKERKDGTIPVYIRVTKDRKHRYKATGISIKEKYWDEKEKLITKAHKYSIRLNKQLQTMLKVFEGRVDELLKEGDPTLDKLKEELGRVVEEYKSQPYSVYNSGGKSLEAAKRIVDKLRVQGLIADHFFFNQKRVIAYTKEWDLTGDDFAEVSDAKIFYREELTDLYENPTLLNDLINDIEKELEAKKSQFLEKTNFFDKV